MTKERVELGPAQETLLIPLYGRAREMQRSRPWMRDERAVELVDSIDYDFSKFSGPTLTGSVLRAAFFDHWVGQFLADHPDGTVVEIGAGLNTRYERLDNGRAHWLELDLPDAIELRRRFFEDTDRRTMLAGSVTDPDWEPVAAAMPGPWCLVSEAVLIYVAEDGVRDVVSRVADGFPGSTLLMDTWGQWFLDNQKAKNSPLEKVQASVDWACEDPAAIEGWAKGVRLRESRTLGDPPLPVRRRLPMRMRLMMPVLSRMPSAKAYLLNRFTIDAKT